MVVTKVHKVSENINVSIEKCYALSKNGINVNYLKVYAAKD